MTSSYTIFIDLDGVLVDFDAGLEAIFGKKASEIPPARMWSVLARSLDFYANLDWMPDGKELWDYLSGYSPIILTGLPRGDWAEPQKRSWCERELGEAIEVITCLTRQKPEKAADRVDKTIPLLIDDRNTIREAWLEMGGVFIHHKSSTESIAELKKLGL